MLIRNRDRLILPGWAPWIALLPIGVLGFHNALDILAWKGEAEAFEAAATASPRLEAMARTRVFASLLPFLLTTLFVTFLFARDYLLLFGRQGRRRLLPAILILAAAGLASSWAAVGLEPGAIGMVGSNVFDEAFAGTQAGPWPLRRVADIVLLIVVAALAIGASAVTLGTISCLAAPSPTLPARERYALHRLQRARLERYLYGSACLLVTGLFVIDSMMRWPAALSAEPALYDNHVNALMLAQGILYSTMIASYYLPVALWLRDPAAEPTTAAARAAEARDEAGLQPSNLLKAVVAILSPAIAGVLTQLIESAGF